MTLAPDTDKFPNVIRGAAALLEALNIIGNSDVEDGDKVIAKIIVDHELDLREIAGFALRNIADDV